MITETAKQATSFKNVVSVDEKLGLWYGKRLNSVWAWLVVFIVAIGSIRGFLIINFDAPLEFVKIVTAGLLLTLAAYGWITKGRYRHPDLIWLKILLKLNLIIGVVNIIIDVSLGMPFDISNLYVYVAPYVVFLFLCVPSFYFNVVIIVVTIATSVSVTDNFIESLKGPEGWGNVMEYNKKLVPSEDVTAGRGRTGEFYRASGYTGNPHDSANILGMAVSFFFIRFLLKGKLTDLGLFLFAMVSLTLTQSATNVLVAILTLIIFAGYIMIQSRKMSNYIFLFFGLLAFSAISAVFGDVMSIFTARIGDEGDWEGMSQQLDMAMLLSGSLFILVGHAAAFGREVINTEIAYLKIIFQLGIVHAAILFGIMLYPLYSFVNNRTFCIDALPSAAAIFFGFMSLLHYGSVFRVTSVFLFYVFFSICLSNLIKAKDINRRAL